MYLHLLLCFLFLFFCVAICDSFFNMQLTYPYMSLMESVDFAGI